MNRVRIQFIYFDLDDTLLDHRQAERQGLADVREIHANALGPFTLDVIHKTYHAHSVPLWKQYADEAITKHDLQHLRFDRTLQTLGIDGLDAGALNALYLDCYARHWTLPTAAQKAFETLAQHFPVGILTNGFAEVQHAKFDRFPALRDRSEVLIISEEVGVMKPHPEIFAHAAAAAGTAPEALLYVGDSYNSDVQGALNAGWQTAWYTQEKATAVDGVFRFAHWDELTGYLLDA